MEAMAYDGEKTREPRITKRVMQNWTEEDACAFCGMPMYYPEDKKYFELEHLEHLVFCSRACATIIGITRNIKMQLTQKQLAALRLELDLEAIAGREGGLLADVIRQAGEEPAKFVREWITKHYFNLDQVLRQALLPEQPGDFLQKPVPGEATPAQPFPAPAVESGNIVTH